MRNGLRKVAEKFAVRLDSCGGDLHMRPRGSDMRSGEGNKNKRSASEGKEDRIHYATECICHDDLGLKATTGEAAESLRRGKGYDDDLCRFCPAPKALAVSFFSKEVNHYCNNLWII